MNQPLSDREERLLLKLNNNILILETDQKLKKWRIEKAALKDLLSVRQKQVESRDEELEDWQKAEKTEVWEPVPPKVTAQPGQPPSDAIVLFEGKDLSAWESVKGGAAQWIRSSTEDAGSVAQQKTFQS